MEGSKESLNRALAAELHNIDEAFKHRPPSTYLHGASWKQVVMEKADKLCKMAEYIVKWWDFDEQPIFLLVEGLMGRYSATLKQLINLCFGSMPEGGPPVVSYTRASLDRVVEHSKSFMNTMVSSYDMSIIDASRLLQDTQHEISKACSAMAESLMEADATLQAVQEVIKGINEYHLQNLG